jgi:hypothetical protein
VKAVPESGTHFLMLMTFSLAIQQRLKAFAKLFYLKSGICALLTLRFVAFNWTRAGAFRRVQNKINFSYFHWDIDYINFLQMTFAGRVFKSLNTKGIFVRLKILVDRDPAEF